MTKNNIRTTSRAFRTPNDEQFDAEHGGELYDNGTNVKQCCYRDEETDERCGNVALVGKPYCYDHIGEVILAQKTSGPQVVTACKACSKHNTCAYANTYFDDDKIARCIIEQKTIEHMIDEYVNTYNIDFTDIRNRIIAERTIVKYINVMRLQDMAAMCSPVVERQRESLDGSIETYLEENPTWRILDKQEMSMYKWFKYFDEIVERTEKKREIANKASSGDKKQDIIDAIVGEKANG